MRTTDTHVFFWGGTYSQWCPCTFIDKDGIVFNCTEQYMMYKKAMVFGDEETAQEILDTESPRDQKALGRQVKGYKDKTWDKYKMDIVTAGNRLKFTQNEDMLLELMDTSNKMIVEASPVDKIWGIGLAPQDDKVLDEANWDGQNLLGKCIMTVRDELGNE